MVMGSVLFLVLLISYFFYMRYVPVRGIKCLNAQSLPEHMIKIDLRDYNDAAKETIAGTISLPIAYIKRHHGQLPHIDICVIASNKVERNIGIRLLQRHGHKVLGYAMLDKPCGCNKWYTRWV
ncbi:hypothetical protein [Amphibacillus cookii]|uniref:hypothetical protein n=1 Tax=Amphibacillus cookii TaxID=767787 RepID=UPI001957D042|nr:hypothetical protein [Amphibacillus cookii]MBM7540067.1 hypothetical protein [Amphibacillus cookii]